MHTVFVINPKAGKGKQGSALLARVEAAREKHPEEIEIYTTKFMGDATRFVRETAMARMDESIRFIACGGDGTFSETANGAIGCANAVVGVFPLGTGNDFCRNFPSDTPFSDIEAQLEGEEVLCDAISCTGKINGEDRIRYGMNMFNIGFDCNVVVEKEKIKKIPFVKGSLAYLFGIFKVLVKKQGADLILKIDGEVVHEGALLLTSVANGSYCGGGIRSNPGASLSDGMMDVNIIYDVSRIEFMKKLPYYAKGTHPSAPGIEKILCEKRCTEMTVIPRTGQMNLCIDGEVVEAEEVTFRILPGALKFSLPRKKCLHTLEENGNIKLETAK